MMTGIKTVAAQTSQKLFAIAGLTLFALIVTLIAPFIGMESIAPSSIFADGVESEIFWSLRVPRTVLAFIAGAALALAGMVFQSMFHNPMATPFTLGVASGASLGAALSIIFGVHFSFLGITGVSIFAMGGAMLSISFVYSLSRAGRGMSTVSTLLAGIAVSFFFSSLNMFIHYMSDFTQTFRIVRWLMGGLEVVSYDAVIQTLPFFIPGAVIVIYYTRELNLLASGDEIAVSRGVNAAFVKGVLFFATSLMVSGVVAVCGPIGFIGMMAPHIMRLIIGADHRYLAPSAALFGGVFLILCDTLARTVIAPAEIPVGVITALIGGPFFLWLLLSQR